MRLKVVVRNSSIIIYCLIVLGIFLLMYSVGSTLIYEFQYTLTKDGITPEEVTKQKLPIFYVGLSFIILAVSIVFFRKRS